MRFRIKNYLIFSKRTCISISICILVIAFLIGLILNDVHASLFAWFSSVVMICFIAGYTVAWVVKVAFVHGLKNRFPEWKKETDQFFFGRFNIFRSPVISGDALPDYMQQDPVFNIIEAERNTVRYFSISWVYIPMTLLVILILAMAFLT